MLAARDVLVGLRVRVLCSQYAAAVAAEAKAFMAQHSGIAIQVRQTREFHDRFLVIDGTICVHMGASIKDAGGKVFMVSRVEDPANRDALLSSIEECWSVAASP